MAKQAQAAAVESAQQVEDLGTRNLAQIDGLRTRIENLQSTRIPFGMDARGDQGAVADAVRVAGYEIAIAIREVGAMLGDALNTESKKPKTGKATFV